MNALLAAVLPRSNMVLLFELPDEILRIAIPKLLGNFRHRKLGIAQKLLRFFHDLHIDVLAVRHPHLLLEHPPQIRNLMAQLLRAGLNIPCAMAEIFLYNADNLLYKLDLIRIVCVESLKHRLYDAFHQPLGPLLHRFKREQSLRQVFLP